MSSINYEIEPIHGIRSLMCLSVYFFHTTYFLRPLIETGDKAWEYLSNPLISSVCGKGVQVDIFFMLSGFLVGLKYFSKVNKPNHFGLNLGWDFLKSRAIRMFPVTICCLVMGVILKDVSWENTPYLFLFMNNLIISSVPSSVVTTWSNAADVQMNFVLIILFSIFGLSIKTSGLLLLTSLIIRLVLVFFSHPLPLTMGTILKFFYDDGILLSPPAHDLITNVLKIPIPPLKEPPIPFGFFLYLPSWSRFGPCVIGYGLSYLYTKSLKDKIQTQFIWLKRPFSWVLLFIIYFLAFFMFLPNNNANPSELSFLSDVIFTVSFQSLTSLGWAGILFTTICPPNHPLHCPHMKSFLSSKFFRWLAPLTFSIYMFHYRILLEFIFNWIPKNKLIQQIIFGKSFEFGEFLSVELFDFWVVCKVCVIVFPVVVLVSYLSYNLIEKPIINFYSNLKSSPKIKNNSKKQK